MCNLTNVYCCLFLWTEVQYVTRILRTVNRVNRSKRVGENLFVWVLEVRTRNDKSNKIVSSVVLCKNAIVQMICTFTLTVSTTEFASSYIRRLHKIPVTNSLSLPVLTLTCVRTHVSFLSKCEKLMILHLRSELYSNLCFFSSDALMYNWSYNAHDTKKIANRSW